MNFNYFVSTGNEMDVTFEDFMEYMIHDEETSVISGYLEGSKNPEKLKSLAHLALEKEKPIVIMKTGRSDAGSKAAASHTGSLAGADKIYDTFFKQYGIVRADDYDDIIVFSKLYDKNRLPKRGNTVIIATSGGRGINESDRCESYGLNVVELSENTKAAIKSKLPSYASVNNPIDLTGTASFTNPEFYLAPLKPLLEDPDVDIILFSEIPHYWTEDTPEFIEFVNLVKETNKIVAMIPFPNEGKVYPPTTKILEENGFVILPGNLNPIRGLSKLVEYGKIVSAYKNETGIEQETTVVQDISNLLPAGAMLSESEASEVLSYYNIPTTKRKLATTAEEAVEFAREIGYPVVLKINSADIPHKTEANAIRLNVSSDEEVRGHFTNIIHNARDYKPNASLNGVSVQEMLPEGVEIIIGAHYDEMFGPIVMVGLGGIFVEVFKDISFKVVPLNRKDAEDAIEKLHGKVLLEGARGKAPVDKEMIIDVLLKVSKLMLDHKGLITELDINPLIVYENGIKAADAMLVVSEDKSLQVVTGG